MASVSQVNGRTALVIQHNAFQHLAIYRQAKPRTKDDGRPPAAPRFERVGRAESPDAVLSLSDQAWPSLCDWENDGDQDLLVGGGYGRSEEHTSELQSLVNLVCRLLLE